MFFFFFTMCNDTKVIIRFCPRQRTSKRSSRANTTTHSPPCTDEGLICGSHRRSTQTDPPVQFSSWMVAVALFSFSGGGRPGCGLPSKTGDLLTRPPTELLCCAGSTAKSSEQQFPRGDESSRVSLPSQWLCWLSRPAENVSFLNQELCFYYYLYTIQCRLLFIYWKKEGLWLHFFLKITKLYLGKGSCHECWFLTAMNWHNKKKMPFTPLYQI